MLAKFVSQLTSVLGKHSSKEYTPEEILKIGAKTSFDGKYLKITLPATAFSLELYSKKRKMNIMMNKLQDNKWILINNNV